MHCNGLALKLKPDAYEEYKRRHDELWPELAQLMADNGISTTIYHFNEYLFVHEVAETAEARDICGQDPVTNRWNKYMADVLETDDDGNLIVHSLPLVFAFGQYE